MGGFAEMAREAEQTRWVNEWVPLDDPALADCPEEFRAQYRFTLARARAAEGRLERHRSAFRALNAVLREVG